MQTTHSTGHTGDTTNLTTEQDEEIADSTIVVNTSIGVTSRTNQSSSGIIPRKKKQKPITM